jgi:hypothetical protein
LSGIVTEEAKDKGFFITNVTGKYGRTLS